MKFLVISFLSLFVLSMASASVSAEKIQHQYGFFLASNFEIGHDVYYNCHSVEMSVTQFLQKTGAENVYVRCAGGIDEFSPPPGWPAHVTLHFQTLKTAASTPANPVSADWKEIKIDSFYDCYLLTQIFEKIQPDLEIKDVEGPNHCFDPDSTFHLQFKALIAD